ncbi:MAG: TLD domain-containing protein [Myxococcales bacterium]|nr:TLD domain-containing protein [Myxococcales bacterium]
MRLPSLALVVIAASVAQSAASEPVVVPPTYIPGMPGSTLVNATDATLINTWIGTPGQRWRRCYSKAADGATSAAFHKNCDGQGPSVTVARLSSGRVIGAYASKSWASVGNWMGDEATFLFSLTYRFKHGYIGKLPSYTQYSATNYGPTFGGGHDWHVNGAIDGGYCYIGYTFECRIGTNGGVDTVCRNDFCGSYSDWKVEDLEVWVH